MRLRRVEVSVNGIPAYDEYVTGLGQRLQVHPRARCQGPWCVIHNPMPGPWENWPTYWDDQGKWMYRQCPHMFMHPAAETPSWHECDGCPCGPGDPNVIDGEWFDSPKELGS